MLKRISKFTVLCSVLVMLFACGGGGSGGSTAPATVSGVVADGYLSGATVCSDQNLNKKCDAGEPTATTDADGRFTLTGSNLNLYPVLVEVVAGVTVDQDTPGTPVAYDYTLSAPADKPEFVSPLTTMVQQQIENTPGLNATAAEEMVKRRLGLPAESDVSLFEDFVAAKQGDVSGDYATLHLVAQVVADTFGQMQGQIETAAIEAGYSPDEILDDLVDIVVERVMAQLDEIVVAVEAAEVAGVEDFDSSLIAEATVASITAEVPLDETIAQEIGGGQAEIKFTEALFGGTNYYAYWTDPDGDFGEEIYAFNTNEDGTYAVVSTWTDYNSAGVQIGDGSETMTATILADGRVRFDFASVDSDTGASYSLATLTASGSDSISFDWIDYSVAGEAVDSGTEQWFTSEQPVGPVPVPMTEITVDGSVADWDGISVLIDDPLNDSSGNLNTEMGGFFVARSTSDLFVRLDLVGVYVFPHTPTMSTSHYEVGIHSYQGSCNPEAGGDVFILNNFTSDWGENWQNLDRYDNVMNHLETLAFPQVFSGSHMEASMPLSLLPNGTTHVGLHPYISALAPYAASGESYDDSDLVCLPLE